MLDTRSVTDPAGFLEEKLSQCSSLEDLEVLLTRFLASGLSVWHDGTLLHTRQLVQRVGNLRLVIYPHDHDPPHFHVWGPDVDARFLLSDCSLLSGDVQRSDRDRIRWVFDHGGKDKLEIIWARMAKPQS